MQPFLNLAPEVYEAIIAAFAVVGLTQSFVLRRKWHQAEKLKADIATISVDAVSLIKETTKVLIEGAMLSSLKVARARTEANAATVVAETALKSANERVKKLEQEIAVFEEAEDVEEAPFPFGSPGPMDGRIANLPGVYVHPHGGGNPNDPFAALFGKGLTPTGRSINSPKIQAFRVTPAGRKPVVAEDFLNSARPTGKAPTLGDIMSLLVASVPRPRPGQWRPADGVKEDVFQYDDRTAEPSTAAAPQKAPQGAVELPGTYAAGYSPERYDPALRAG